MDPQMDGLLNEIPTKMDDNWGYPYDLGNLHMSIPMTRTILFCHPSSHLGRLRPYWYSHLA